MSRPNAIAAINEWSCALACISWFMEVQGKPISQQDIIYQYWPWFPEWVHRPGVLLTGDIVNLCLRLGFPVRKVVHLNDKDESLRILSKYYSHNNFHAGFVITRQPTNHCFAIVSVTATHAELMDPDRGAPAFRLLTWVDLFNNNDPDILWMFP